MSSVLEQLNNVAFTNTNLPKLERDGLAIQGTLTILDFGSDYSYPEQDDPTTGDLVNLKTDGTPDGDVSTDWTWVSPNGLRRPSGAASSRVNCGVHDLTDISFAVVGWVKINTTAATSFTPLISNIATTSDNAGNQFSLYVGSGGIAQLVAQIKTDVAQSSEVTGEVLSADTVYQLGLSMEILSGSNVLVKVFIDGLKVYQQERSGTTINDVATGIALGNRHASSTGGSSNYTYYRVALEDLTTSGRTAEQFIAKDYELNDGRFS